MRGGGHWGGRLSPTEPRGLEGSSGAAPGHPRYNSLPAAGPRANGFGSLQRRPPHLPGLCCVALPPSQLRSSSCPCGTPPSFRHPWHCSGPPRPSLLQANGPGALSLSPPGSAPPAPHPPWGSPSNSQPALSSAAQHCAQCSSFAPPQGRAEQRSTSRPCWAHTEQRPSGNCSPFGPPGRTAGLRSTVGEPEQRCPSGPPGHAAGLKSTTGQQLAKQDTVGLPGHWATLLACGQYLVNCW